MQLRKIKDKKDLDFFRQISKPVSPDDNIKDVVNGMFNILYSNDAIGMAAVMVGLPKRIVIVDLQEHGKKPMILLNPEIIKKSKETIALKESSISIDNVEGNIERARTITVKYKDLDFKDKELKASDLLSVCLQHEIDYLDGKLFIDYMENSNEIIENLTKMKVKNIIDDSEILRTKCTPVRKITDEIKDIMNQMLQTMYDTRGIGLTANQVGIAKQLIVIDLQENDIKSPIFLINPKIVEHSKNTIISEKEGCLSVPDARADVPRYETVKVEYLDLDGNKQVINADGLLAICLQHEIDHTKGKLYIDYLSKLKRDTILKKVKKYLKTK